jgi:hypothetical protein
MTLFLWLAITFGCQSSTIKSETRDIALAARIQRLFHTIVTTDDQKEEAAARAEVNQIYTAKGFPTIDEVGDEPSYEFVVLMTSEQLPTASQTEILSKVEEASAGQADPESYAKVYGRSQRDLGRKQLYGEQLECNAGEKDARGPGRG